MYWSGGGVPCPTWPCAAPCLGAKAWLKYAIPALDIPHVMAQVVEPRLSVVPFAGNNSARPEDQCSLTSKSLVNSFRTELS